MIEMAMIFGTLFYTALSSPVFFGFVGDDAETGICRLLIKVVVYFTHSIIKIVPIKNAEISKQIFYHNNA